MDNVITTMSQIGRSGTVKKVSFEVVLVVWGNSKISSRILKLIWKNSKISSRILKVKANNLFR